MSKPIAQRKHPTGHGTLGERFYYAGGTAVLAIFLGALLWALVNLKYGMGHTLPFAYVLYFTAAMAFLAFALCQNVVVEIFAAVIEVILDPPDERIPHWFLGIGVLLVMAFVAWCIYAA